MSRRARRGGEEEGEREKGTNIMMGRMRRFNCEEGREDREREGQFRERKIHSVSVRAKERKSMLSLSLERDELSGLTSFNTLLFSSSPITIPELVYFSSSSSTPKC